MENMCLVPELDTPDEQFHGGNMIMNYCTWGYIHYFQSNPFKGSKVTGKL